MKAHTRETQETMTPEKALQYLVEGNDRFVNNLKAHRNLLEQVNETSEGQFPFATILSCIDSRVSAELIFDQGLGDIFSIRIAGNFINEDILGSMEFASKLAGTKLIMVLGHTSCGAIKGACDHVRMGHLTNLVNKIEPAVYETKEPKDESLRNSSNLEFVDAVSHRNVERSLENIRERSAILAQMEKKGEIKLIGAMYDLSTGEVTLVD
ncbi:MAG: carbonic anhydrase family protein [Nonlabens sp.]|nr:carbonic anhydrase family protein [Nonlabens sp.]